MNSTAIVALMFVGLLSLELFRGRLKNRLPQSMIASLSS
jgi:hypothetical protein